MSEKLPIFYPDLPVQSATQDALRKRIARELAVRLQTWHGQESLVLALHVAWGSGKSSVNNMALEYLRSDETCCPDNSSMPLREALDGLDYLEADTRRGRSTRIFSFVFSRCLGHGRGEKRLAQSPGGAQGAGRQQQYPADIPDPPFLGGGRQRRQGLRQRRIEQ